MGVFSLQELVSAFIVLFAVIDIIGAVPIILDLKQKGRSVNAIEATLISAGLLLAFFFAGDMILKLFQVDIASFAVAGAFVIFFDVARNDTGHRDIQEYRSYQGGYVGAVGFPVACRGWVVYYFVVFAGGICNG